MSEQMIQADSIASEKVCDHPSTEKAANELNACPFCQSELGPLVYTVENWNGERVTSEVSYVECEACGAKGPEAVGPKAVEAWNRAAPPDGQVIANPANSLRGQPESSDPSLLGRETVREETIEECAKLIEDFGWTIPMYAPYANANVNAATDEVACMVTNQIAAAIRSLSPLKE